MKRIYYALIFVAAVLMLGSCTHESPGNNTNHDSSTNHGGGIPDPNSLNRTTGNEHAITDPKPDFELSPFKTDENLYKE